MWVSLLPVLLMFAIFSVVWWLHTRGTVKGGKLVMLPNEIHIAEIVAQAKGIKYSGFVFVGTPSDGKLLLTNLRLIHKNVKGDKVGLVLFRDHIQQIAKGKDGPLMTLELDYQTPQMKKPKHIRFLQISSVSGLDPRQQLPIGMFIDRLLAWKAERAA
jgi:hypothetical protein